MRRVKHMSCLDLELHISRIRTLEDGAAICIAKWYNILYQGYVFPSSEVLVIKTEDRWKWKKV